MKSKKEELVGIKVPEEFNSPTGWYTCDGKPISQEELDAEKTADPQYALPPDEEIH